MAGFSPAPGASGTPARPRAMVLHGESLFCAGAQRMLAYFLEGAGPAGLEAVLAMAPNPKLAALLPPGVQPVPLPENQRFSTFGLLRQGFAVRQLVRQHRPAVLHGWTARDWELCSLATWLAGVPAVGLLHDHPEAPHISASRRRMMRTCARQFLARVLCVSGAVARECERVGYRADRLRVVRNGIPHPPIPQPCRPQPGEPVRLGFLGVFSERKGIQVLFEVLRQLHALRPSGWDVHLGGGTQEEQGERLMEGLKARYSSDPWWSRIRWHGWIRHTPQFLAQLDLLIVPSAEFDPFPTVLLEAGSAARPVLAARVGGVEEIVMDGQTGWFFDPAQPALAAAQLDRQLARPADLAGVGLAAARRVREHFSVETMVHAYTRLYREVLGQPTDLSARP